MFSSELEKYSWEDITACIASKRSRDVEIALGKEHLQLDDFMALVSPVDPALHQADQAVEDSLHEVTDGLEGVVDGGGHVLGEPGSCGLPNAADGGPEVCEKSADALDDGGEEVHQGLDHVEVEPAGDGRPDALDGSPKAGEKSTDDAGDGGEGVHHGVDDVGLEPAGDRRPDSLDDDPAALEEAADPLNDGSEKVYQRVDHLALKPAGDCRPDALDGGPEVFEKSGDGRGCVLHEADDGTGHRINEVAEALAFCVEDYQDGDHGGDGRHDQNDGVCHENGVQGSECLCHRSGHGGPSGLGQLRQRYLPCE